MVAVPLLLLADEIGPDQHSLEAVKANAEKGDVHAQSNLGLRYFKGQGVAQDLGEAVKWFRKAAEQGDAAAQFNLGSSYDNGQGVTKDNAEAVKWYRKAAEQGNVNAQNNLGTCYVNGQGIDQDYAEAVKWFRKAAEQGDARGQNNLGVAYYKGVGVTQDYAEAAEWYRKAAEQGHALAQSSLSVFYYCGLGVTTNYAEAVKWCRKAAKQGVPLAQTNLQTFEAKLSMVNPMSPENANVGGTDDSTMPTLSLEKFDIADDYVHRANVSLSQNNYDAAWADFNKAIELKSGLASAYFGRASVKEAKGYHNEALDDLRVFLKIQPDAQAYNTVGVWMWTHCFYEKSEEYYTKAIELKPDFAEAYNNRGAIKSFKSIYGSTRLDEAIEDYDKAIEISPDFAQAYLGRSSVKRRKGDMDGWQADYNIFKSIQSKIK